jgi:hypothetical protein
VVILPDDVCKASAAVSFGLHLSRLQDAALSAAADAGRRPGAGHLPRIS